MIIKITLVVKTRVATHWAATACITTTCLLLK